MTISKGKTYRHMSCTEVDMHVITINAIEADHFKLVIAWVNRHHPNIHYPDYVNLKFTDLDKWEQIKA